MSTFVLIHSAWHGGWCWSRVAKLLRAAVHEVHTPTLAGMGEQLARHLARTLPGARGFTRRNLFRMRQFYEAYVNYKKVSPLATQLPRTHNLIILGQSKRPEEREFYVRMALQTR